MATATPRNFLHRLALGAARTFSFASLASFASFAAVSASLASLGAAGCGRYYDEAPLPLAPTAAPKAVEVPKRPPFVLGATVPRDVDDAAWELLLRCDADEPKACTDLGRLFASTRWNARDDAKASAFYARACHGGDGAGCEDLADALVHGRGVPKDVAKGLALHERACHEHQVFSCAVVGALYAAGYSVSRDLPRARELLGRACEEGDSSSCELGSPVEACAAGDATGCEELDALKGRYEAQPP